jgi:hypothetical protein
VGSETAAAVGGGGGGLDMRCEMEEEWGLVLLPSTTLIPHTTLSLSDPLTHPPLLPPLTQVFFCGFTRW